MSPLAYLTLHKAKNKLFELFRKPLKLIVTLAFIALIVMNFSLSGSVASGQRPLVEFKAIILAFYILCFVTESRKGFLSGGTMFSLTDVNLLFMSPLKPFLILFYGMLSRLGSSLFMALAFVYQFTLLRSYYPITPEDMLTAVAGYAAVVFLSQLTGMLIYFYTCGDAVKIKKAKAVLYSVCGFFAILCAVRLLSSEVLSLTSLALSATSLPVSFFPVAGWVFTAVDGFLLSDTLKLSFGLLPCVIFCVVVFVILAFSRHGYYEDVLLSAEKNADARASENMQSVAKIRRNAGALKGFGASVIFRKHMLENRRTKSSLLTPTSIFYLVLLGVYGFLFDGDFTMLFSLSCMVSFLPVLSGKWLKELTLPHIYLIPEPPVKKLFYMLFEMLPKVAAESILQCALISLLCDLGLISFVAVTQARASVSFVLMASALLMARIFREKEKNNIFIAMSVLPGIIFILPSVFAFIVTLNFMMSYIIAFAVMSAVNAAVSLLLLFFARNLLKITE